MSPGGLVSVFGSEEETCPLSRSLPGEQNRTHSRPPFCNSNLTLKPNSKKREERTPASAYCAGAPEPQAAHHLPQAGGGAPRGACASLLGNRRREERPHLTSARAGRSLRALVTCRLPCALEALARGWPLRGGRAGLCGALRRMRSGSELGRGSRCSVGVLQGRAGTGRGPENVSDTGTVSRRERGAAIVSSTALPRAPAAYLAAERSEGPGLRSPEGWPRGRRRTNGPIGLPACVCSPW